MTLAQKVCTGAYICINIYLSFGEYPEGSNLITEQGSMKGILNQFLLSSASVHNSLIAVYASSTEQ